MEIKIKNLGVKKLPEIIKKGDWIDLRTAEDITLDAPQAEVLKRTKKGSFRNVTFNSKLIPLGIAMQLPKGYEAIILPRSSTFKKYGIILANSQGIIDNSYNGDTDEWMFNAIALRATTILANTRIAQFRVQLSQKATIWRKIKWLLNNKIKIKEVKELNNTNRGGFGSTD